MTAFHINRPDPPEESKAQQEYEIERYVIQARYVPESPDDASVSSNWAPPSSPSKGKGMKSNYRFPTRDRLEEVKLTDFNDSSSQISDWRPPMRATRSESQESGQSNLAKNVKDLKTDSTESILGKTPSHASMKTASDRFIGFDPDLVVASWGLPILEKSKFMQDNSHNSPAGHAALPILGRESAPQASELHSESLMEEGRIFTHDECSKEDDTTEGSISEASPETVADSGSQSSSSDTDSGSDLEMGKLAFESVAPHQQGESINDQDIMMRGSFQTHDTNNQRTVNTLDVEIGGSAFASDDKVNSKPSRPWSLLIIVCVMIALLIGGGVAATLIFLREPNSTPTPKPSPPSQSIGPTFPPAGLDEGVGSFIASSLASVGGTLSLQDPNSAQAKALEWLLDNELLEDYGENRVLQRYTMAVLFYASNGSGWSSNAGWLSDQDECTWYSSGSETNICTDQGLVGEFNLDKNNVGGTLPWLELAMLSNQLIGMDFFQNEVAGSFPSQVGLLTALTAVDLFSNRLSGELPTELGSLESLQFFNADTNFLTGNIPSQVAQMTSLTTLSLRNNILSGTIPTELGRMTNLRDLYLSNNFLSGSMPEEICALGLDNLEVSCDLVTCDCCTSCTGGGGGTGEKLMDLISANSPDNGAALQDPNSPQAAAFEWLSRPINEGFSDARLLQRYALATVYFATGGGSGSWTSSTLWLTGSDECQWYTSGSPETICTNNGSDDQQYVQLNLRQNGLEGSLPAEVSMLTMLETLRLPRNDMTGTLPTSLADMPRLQYLDLASNKFVEEAPAGDNIFASANANKGVFFSRLGDMTSLTHLSLFENFFETTIPRELGFLSSNLRVLDLGKNLLFGTVPSELGRLTDLVGLSVVDNFLSGSIPTHLSDLTKLETFYIDNNDLGPPIPLGLCQVTTLTEFWSDCEEVGCICCTSCCSDGFGCVAV
jgi:Leucine-rich repeat (LRR) protein